MVLEVFVEIQLLTLLLVVLGEFGGVRSLIAVVLATSTSVVFSGPGLVSSFVVIIFIGLTVPVIVVVSVVVVVIVVLSIVVSLIASIVISITISLLITIAIQRRTATSGFDSLFLIKFTVFLFVFLQGFQVFIVKFVELLIVLLSFLLA